MKTRTLLICCAGACTVAIASILLGSWLFFRHLLHPFELAIPPDIQEARTVVAELPLTKKVFIQTPKLGRITSIVLGELDPAPGSEIGVSGTRGALFVDLQGRVKAAVVFKPQTDSGVFHSSSIIGDVDIIDVEGDHVCEFLNRGSIDGTSLIDHQGNTLWTYADSSVSDVASGDIDGDGVAEFVVGHGGDRGIELFDRNGHKMWQQPDGNVWHVEIANVGGSGTHQITHSNVGGDIIVRDRHGSITTKTDLPFYLGPFSVCNWPDKNGKEYLISADHGVIRLFDVQGKILARFNAPLGNNAHKARGTPVKFRKGISEYIAVVVNFAGLPRSVLYVFDQNGALVYQEVLPESCGSILAVSFDDSGSEGLLIGGEQEVWQYTFEQK